VVVVVVPGGGAAVRVVVVEEGEGLFEEETGAVALDFIETGTGWLRVSQRALVRVSSGDEEEDEEVDKCRFVNEEEEEVLVRAI
jgi:hypothetical protein